MGRATHTMKVMKLIAFLSCLALAAQGGRFGEEAFAAFTQGDHGKSDKRGTHPLSAILSSLAGADTATTVYNNLKPNHPEEFRQDGLQLRGFPTTADGFYYRLRLDNPNEQPPLQKSLVKGNIWYKKDDKHFVVRSTKHFPHSDGNWGLVQLKRQRSYQPGYKRSYVYRGFVSQHDADSFWSEVEEADGGTAAFLAAKSHRAAKYTLSLGAYRHPPKTTLVLTKHYIDSWRNNHVVVSEEIIKLQ